MKKLVGMLLVVVLAMSSITAFASAVEDSSSLISKEDIRLITSDFVLTNISGT